MKILVAKSHGKTTTKIILKIILGEKVLKMITELKWLKTGKELYALVKMMKYESQ
jgi:molybdopterin-binding protein